MKLPETHFSKWRVSKPLYAEFWPLRCFNYLGNCMINRHSMCSNFVYTTRFISKLHSRALRKDQKQKNRSSPIHPLREVPLFVSLRPGVLDFISWLKSQDELLEVAVYTAGTKPYATQSLEKLGLEGQDVLVLAMWLGVGFRFSIVEDRKEKRRNLDLNHWFMMIYACCIKIPERHCSCSPTELRWSFLNQQDAPRFSATSVYPSAYPSPRILGLKRGGWWNEMVHGSLPRLRLTTFISTLLGMITLGGFGQAPCFTQGVLEANGRLGFIISNISKPCDRHEWWAQQHFSKALRDPKDP